MGCEGKAEGCTLDFCLSFPLFLQFPDETLRSGELLNMIVAVIDSAQVNTELSSQEAWGHGALLPAPHVPLLAQGRWGGQEKQAPRAAEERLRGATPAGRTDTAGLRVRKALRSPSIAAGLSIKQENTKMLRGLLPGSLP